MKSSLCMLVALTWISVLHGQAQAAGSPEDYLKANKCTKCHTDKTTKKGPSYASLAEKYKGDTKAAGKLLNTLKTGGKEDHDKAPGTDAELQAVISFILSSK